MEEFWSYQIFGVAVVRLQFFVGIIILTLIFRRIFDRYIAKALLAWAQKTRFTFDNMLVEALSRPFSALFLVSGFYIAVVMLNLPRTPYNLVTLTNNAFKISLTVIGVWAFLRLTDLMAEGLQRLFGKNEDDELSRQFAPLIRQGIHVTILAIGGIMIIQNMGYSAGSLLAGLGIGGLAIALAAQDTLANLFGTFVMFTDRPFKVGDWIQIKGVEGDVEQIGFRSTRIRTFAKSQVTVPNKLFAVEIVENWTAMPRRRVKFTLSLTYSTTPDKIRVYVERLRELLKNDPDVDPTSFTVHFNEFGPSALEILVYYFTTVTAWAEYIEVRQRLNLRMMEIAREMSVSFAFPSQTVYFGEPLRLQSNTNISA